MMKKFMILLSLILISVNVNAQTFKCTDIVFSDYAASFERKVQKAKKKGLGSILKLEIYENDIKAEICGIENEKPEIAVFTRVSNNHYEYKYREARIVLKLKTILGYINECEVVNYDDGIYIATVKYKREIF